MVNVHNRCTFAEFGEITDNGVAHIRGFAAAAALHNALPEQLAFGDDGNGWRTGQQSLVQRCYRQGQRMV